MTTYKRGAVILAPFPFTDLSGNKQRPAVILSVDRFNSSQANCIVAAITGNLSNLQPDDYLLGDWKTAGLVKPSIVKAVIGTLHHQQIVRQLGVLAASDLKEVERKMKAVLGL